MFLLNARINLYLELAWYAVEASVRRGFATQDILLSRLDHIYFTYIYLRLFADTLREHT